MCSVSIHNQRQGQNKQRHGFLRVKRERARSSRLLKVILLVYIATFIGTNHINLFVFREHFCFFCSTCNVDAFYIGGVLSVSQCEFVVNLHLF